MTKATDLDTLADDLLITEERTTQIALEHRPKTVDHTLTLRRDSAAATSGDRCSHSGRNLRRGCCMM